MPYDILRSKKLIIGFDPKIFTSRTLEIFFRNKNCKFKPLQDNLLTKFGKGKEKKKRIVFTVCRETQSEIIIKIRLIKL